MDNEYELRYLPLFYEDMYEKISYIKDKFSFFPLPILPFGEALGRERGGAIGF